MAGFTIEREGSTCSVVMRGNLIAALVPDLQAAVREQLAQGTAELSVDLGQTTMLDSTGIGFLIAARNSVVRQNGSMKVVGASPDILQLLQSMRLVSRLNVSGREARSVDHG